MTLTTKTKSYLWGVVAILTMTIFYLAIMFGTMTPTEVWLNFKLSWYLLVGIIFGFGVQIGLFVYLKNCIGEMKAAVPGTSGAMSGTAMVACCAHHLADILPVLGVSGAAIFLTQYQRPFLILGLAVNLLGIAYMLYLIEKYRKSMSLN